MSILILEHGPTTGSLRLGRMLRDYGHRLRVISLHEGDVLPPNLDDVDGVVTCGGPQSAMGDEPWLEPEMEYLRAAHEGSIPTVGLCLGSQILARALGGEVGPVEGGIELGWQAVTLSDLGREDVIHAGIAWESMQFHWHREQVIKVPPEARVLAASARCPVQAWALGLRTYAFQYHPEVFPETIETWAADEPQALREAGTTIEQVRGDTERYYSTYERLAERLFDSLALFLMPVDRRVDGLVKDLHH